MAFIPVPNTAEVVLKFLYDGQQTANVFHVEYGAPPTVLQLGDIAVAAGNWWINTMKPIVAGSLQLVEVVARDLTAVGAPAVAVGYVGQIGGDPGTAMPNHVSLAIKWFTGLAGRSYRGRTYHQGLTDPQVTLNQATTGSLVAFQTGYADLRTALNANTGVMVVVSRYSGVDPITKKPIPRASGVTTPITGLSIEPTIDSMRRRLPGRGR